MTEMVLELKVIANCSRNELKGNRVYVMAPAVDNQANEAMIELLADYYNVKRNRIKIMRGLHSSTKVVKIL